MPRKSFGKPNNEEKRALVPLEELSQFPEDYADAGTGILMLAIALSAKARAGKDEQSVAVPDQVQIQYVNMRAAGMTQAEACKLLGIDRAMPMLWEEVSDKDSVYAQCVRIIKRIEAENLEAVVWRRATTVASASLERMFALKSRMSEYKDNAPAATFKPQIRITIGGKNFDTAANLKEVVDVTDGEFQHDSYAGNQNDDDESRMDTYIGDGQ